jgi:hypothetical protein
MSRFAQEMSLALNIPLAWPSLLLEWWGWIAAFFNFNISLAGPECFGEWGYAQQWALNAFGPVILLLVHGMVYVMRHCCASSPEKRARFSWQFVGSLFFWVKMIFMNMQALMYEASMHCHNNGISGRINCLVVSF